MKRFLITVVLIVATAGLAVPSSAAAAPSPDPMGGTRSVTGPLEVAAPYLAYKQAAAPTVASPSAAPTLASTASSFTACVSGIWGYQDLSSGVAVNRPSQNYQFQVWDKDAFDEDDFLANGVTDGLGVYAACFDNADDDGGLCCWGGQDVYVKFVAENTAWTVHDNATKQPYVAVSPVFNDLPDGTTHDFMSLQPGDTTQMGASAVFDSVNQVFKWGSAANSCWDPNDVVCRQMVLNWRFDNSQSGSFYDAAIDEVMLAKNAHLFPDIVMHEAGHAIMDDVYGDAYPDGAACSVPAAHNVGKKSSPTCAWAEGFASWIPLMVKKSPNSVLPNPNGGANVITNMESLGWFTTNWDTGPDTEGRVTAALWDLSDTANVNVDPNETWDRNTDLPATPFAPGKIWKTFVAGGKPQTFKEFWAQRASDPNNNNVSPTGGLGSVYQNTIDIDFRDPLSNNAPVTRPTPFNPHNFSFNTTTNHWSAVAVAPPAGVDYDLDLFTDKAQVSNLKSSTAGAGIVDFVAIDSNQGKQPLGDFYPRVRRFNNVGLGTCTVELAQGSQSLPVGATKAIAMPASDLVDVWDVFISQNTQAKVTFSASAGLYQAFLFSSASGGFIKARNQAAVTTSTIAFGSPQTLTFTPGAGAGGWHGLVIVKTSGSGTLTMKRVT
jgi:hypothetical protein